MLIEQPRQLEANGIIEKPDYQMMSHGEHWRFLHRDSEFRYGVCSDYDHSDSPQCSCCQARTAGGQRAGTDRTGEISAGEAHVRVDREGQHDASLSAEMLKSLAGIDIVHVAYKSLPEYLNDTLGGNINLASGGGGATRSV
jgi:hypothetical protein